MAKSREKKSVEIEKLVERLGRMKVAVLTTTSGLKVKDINELRSLLRKSSVEYVVAKKTLVRRALEQASLAGNVDLSPLAESFALSFGFDDVVAPAKLLSQFSKTHDSVKFVGGIMDGAFVTGEQIKALAALPSIDELRGRLVGSIASPLSGFVRVLNGNLAGLVRVLDGYQKSRTASA